MHIVIAFFIIAGAAAVPCFWIVGFVTSLAFMGFGRPPAPVWPAIALTVAVALLGSLAFGGLWSVLVPMLGGVTG